MNCTGPCARLAALETLGAWVVYLLLLFGPRAWLLKGQRQLTAAEWRATYPALRWLPILHDLMSVVVLTGSMVSTIWVIQGVSPPTVYGLATVWAIALLNAFSGLFELATGVCPVYGVFIKRSYRQRFIRHPAVRRLGLVRMLISLTLLGGVILLARRV